MDHPSVVVGNLEGADANEEAAFRTEIDALRNKEKKLETQMASAGVGKCTDPWIDMDELRQKLAARRPTSISCASNRPISPLIGLKPKRLPAIYVAWISSRNRDTRIVNLGPADKIDAAIQAARQELQDSFKHIREEGELLAEKAARQKLAAVSELVLTPLLPHLQGFRSGSSDRTATSG